MFGLILGVLALLAYFAFVFFEASLAHAKAIEEKRRIQTIMEQHAVEQASVGVEPPSYSHSDPQLDQLLAGGQTSAAEQHARERLQLAHEQGDQQREALYRGYLHELEQAQLNNRQ